MRWMGADYHYCGGAYPARGRMPATRRRLKVFFTQSLPLALQCLRAASQDRAEGKRANQRRGKYLDHLAAPASWNRVVACPIDMRSVARRSTSERPVLMRGWEAPDN